MSLSISVIAPSGELSWLTGGLAGSSAEAITSIEVRFAERSTVETLRPPQSGEHSLTAILNHSRIARRR